MDWTCHVPPKHPGTFSTGPFPQETIPSCRESGSVQIAEDWPCPQGTSNLVGETRWVNRKLLVSHGGRL